MFGGSAGNGVVGWDVKPGVLAVYKEQVFFGRFVLPTHFSGSAEIGDAGFGADNAAVFRISLEESGGKSVVAVVAGFQFGSKGFGFR